ncbi:MAG TPA: glycosyl hydrolase family 8 [Polyangiaceae bacterium]|jgi:MYXO-CTERM domain-containing protein
MARTLARALLSACAVLAGVSVAGPARAQRRPFPQHPGYAHGFVPAGITNEMVQSSYRNWKNRYLMNDCGEGTYRVDFDSPHGSTVSEGMGYGMVIAAYMGERDVFDGLWKFVQKNLDKDGLMGWKVTCKGFDESVGGAGSATDGDADIGFALVAAIDQWGDAYRQTALDYLATLKRVDFTTCPDTRRNVAKMGNWGGGCDHSNTSYWMPGYYRVFAELTKDDYWSKAADDAIALWLSNRNAKTGLVADEVDGHGVTVKGKGHVDYNGCRIPWRAALDYLWYGTAGAKDLDDRMTDWATSVGIGNLVDGYETDGKPTSNAKYRQLNVWVGGWTCGAMTKSQASVDAFAGDFAHIADDNGSYYGSSLRTLYLLMLSGNFWKPGGLPPLAASAAVPAPSVAPSASPADAGPPPGVPVDPRHPLAFPPAPPPRATCGCDVVGSSGPGGGAWLAVAAAGLAIGRRRRAR